MNNIIIFTLKALRKVYQKIFASAQSQMDYGITEPEKAADVIYDLLSSGKPCLIARFGGFELSTLVNYLGVTSSKHSVWQFIKGKQPEWWWNKSLMLLMQSNAGFFPSTEDNLMEFGKMMLEDAKEVDILGSWQQNERYVSEYVNSAVKVHLLLLEPFWSEQPWSRVLEGKRVLVVHPFAKTIELQYSQNRTKLFDHPAVLPEFELQTIQAVQSIGGIDNGFKDWFEALQWMKDEIDRREYDVCLIGCGAYGFPLAAHVKRRGKQAVHLGGALQLLFGIRGKRWEDPNYGVKGFGVPYGRYSNLMNVHWVRPEYTEKPISSNAVEGGCYW